MQILNSKLMYSPSDIVTFLESEFGSWMDRWWIEVGSKQKTKELAGLGTAVPPEAIRKDEGDDTFQILLEEGLKHEKAFLAKLKKNRKQVVEIEQTKGSGEESLKATIAAMKAGAECIYQARLEDGNLAGWADFLFRLDGNSNLGRHHYEVSDCKLANSTKPYFLLQLCAYAELLERLQGKRPEEIRVVLGTGETKSHRTDRFFFYYRELKQALMEFQKSFDASKPPRPQDSRGYGRWSGLADAILRKIDHLSLVARITRNQIKKLEDAGIRTVAALAESGPDFDRVPRLSDQMFDRLRRQASLQIRSKEQDKPLFEVMPPDTENNRLGLALLPPLSDADVFFDMEGFPLIQGGLEYLFGAACREGGKVVFKDWWAHDAIQEKRAFEEFVDWVHDRWNRNRSLHIYHYAAYEVSALKRLMGKYGSREDKVDELLRNHVFVDLYTVVRQGVLIGTEGYGLKDIESIFREKRAGDVTSAAGSVVAYHRWLASKQGQDWKDSPILEEIRKYNEQDCLSLVDLIGWLKDLQRGNSISWVDPASRVKDQAMAPEAGSPKPWAALAASLLQEIAEGKVSDPERLRLQELLAFLLEFHRREAKPMWWRFFARLAMEDEELVDDPDCLGGLTRTTAQPRAEKRSIAYEYQFDPAQDTKLEAGDDCYFTHDQSLWPHLVTIDREAGRLEIKLGPGKPAPPTRVALIPRESVSAESIQKGIWRYVQAWHAGESGSSALDDLLARRSPRVRGHAGGPLIAAKGDFTAEACDIISRLENSILCVQGPPGTGKTTLAAAAILKLVRAGKRIGVTATGHKTILNVLQAIHRTAQQVGGPAVPLFRAGNVESDKEEPLVKSKAIRLLGSGQPAVDALPEGPCVVGGTAWFFSNEGVQDSFDYLFIDEAGQFSLANVVGTGLCARNLVLVGDQMQLAQPIQGTHPGDSGQSALDYLLQGRATIPPEFGIFLEKTRRMHPDVCRFISDAVYEGRLTTDPATSGHRIVLPSPAGAHVQRETGIVFVPVRHDGNSLGSSEEADVVEQIVRELLGARVQDNAGSPARALTLEDILFVAPFNVQVRELKRRLGPGARVGSVDKFQGQEAHVVVVSMCSSTLEDSPRGADFLLSPNRINVAVSRAKTLAVVVASPALLTARCETVGQMELVNLLCWLKASGTIA